jgi:hypothetical protein
MRTVLAPILALSAVDQTSETPQRNGRRGSPLHRHKHLITYERDECRSPQATGIRARV